MFGSALDRIVDWVENFIHLFKFWVILDEYERGIRLTWGIRRSIKFWKWEFRPALLEPGLHLILPFGIEEVLVDNVVPMPEARPTLTLTTNDNKVIALTPVCSWSIDDMTKFVLGLEGGEGVLDLCVDAVIAKRVGFGDLADLYEDEFWKDVLKEARRESRKWGVKLQALSFCELYETEVGSHRVLGDLDLGNLMGEADDE